MNVSLQENCTEAQKSPRGFQTTQGAWVALNSHLQVLHPPMELQLDELRMGDIDPEAAAMGGAYKTKDLLR